MSRPTADDILREAVREHIKTGALDSKLARAVADETQLLTAKQAAKLLELPVTRFRRLGLPIVHFGPKGTRWKLSTIKAEIDKRTTKPKQRR